jgi:hypothetical protein
MTDLGISAIKYASILGLGMLIGVGVYKRLHPPGGYASIPPPISNEEKLTTETITRYITKEGAVKEIIVNTIKEKKAIPVPMPIEHRKNIISLLSTSNLKGEVNVGAQYGRELFPNVYVTGGALFNTSGQPKAAVIGAQINF